MLIKSEIEVDAADLRQALSKYLSSKMGTNIDVEVKEVRYAGTAITMPITVKGVLKKQSYGYMDR